MVSLDVNAEKQLRALFEKSKSADYVRSPEYGAIRKGMDETRTTLIGPRIKAVKKSLEELLAYARPRHVRLGLENRYHYFDIPSPDEMGELLALAGPDELGFVYDVGHAQALDRLGFYPREEWLRRFSERIIEVHLHDVQGVNDHFAPGLGDVDYSLLAGCLPADAIRTFEVQASNTPEQVRAGLHFLAEQGIVRKLS
jgi:sugar phosphate isomerase/epimerase